MTNIYKIFKELSVENQIPDGSYHVKSIPKIKNHKLGIDINGAPMFFIKCEEDSSIKTIDTSLELISIQYNQKCQINYNKETSVENFTIIRLNTSIDYLHDYFIKIISILLKKLPENPSLTALKNEFESIIDLFSKFTSPPIKTVQGLWAELLIIEQSSNPEYLINAWHNSTMDKFDFNDGFDKVEVKSTAKTRRIHNFSLEQLGPNGSSNLVIASVKAIQTGTGKNIFQLIEDIESSITNYNSLLRLNQIVATTIGNEIEKLNNFYFDYKFAVDSLKFFESRTIPTIDPSNIPANISNIKFECDLTGIDNLTCYTIESKLIQSLFPAHD